MIHVCQDLRMRLCVWLCCQVIQLMIYVYLALKIDVLNVYRCCTSELVIKIDENSQDQSESQNSGLYSSSDSPAPCPAPTDPSMSKTLKLFWISTHT